VTHAVMTVQVNLPERVAAMVGKSTIQVRGVAEDQSVLTVIRATGQYEPHVMQAMIDSLPVGGTCIDVGANFGVLSTLAAFRVGSGGKVLAIEASPVTHALLQETLMLNGCPNVVALNRGVWHEPATLDFHHVPHGPGWSFFSAVGAEATGCEFRVQCTTLDAIAEDMKFDHVDLVKIDVEGAEVKVLVGAKQTLQRHRPDLIVEINPVTLKRFSGTDPAELYRCIREYGYDMSVIARDSSAIVVREYGDLERLFATGHTWVDVSCTHKG